MLKSTFSVSVSIVALLAAANTAKAMEFDIPNGDLKAALDSYARTTGVTLLYADDAIKGVRTKGARGDLSDSAALSRILTGTGFSVKSHADGTITILKDTSADAEIVPLVLAQGAPVSRASVETVTVTSSKLGGTDVQSVPIAITALSQEQLTATQTAGGPDLVKSVPNLTFTKTNFTGYNIQIRGIGTQAISVTTDPAVAVAFNDLPFIRNHFFEQEFYDVSQVEVLRGPQGTLYGRNATAGVVNLISAKPTDQWEAMASVDVGNYNNRRLEGMLNVPVWSDKLGVRVAGEWTKRDGYAFNETTNRAIDGRDLWSGRITVGFKPIPDLQIIGIWEHFQEDDDRARSTKQLCKKDAGPSSIGGVDISNDTPARAIMSQGCLPVSLYSPEAYETPNGQSNPIVAADEFFLQGPGADDHLLHQVDPYASVTQPRSLRVIQSEINPTYTAKNDTYELSIDYKVMPVLTLTSQTGYSQDHLRSTEDFNRFNTTPGIFSEISEGAQSAFDQSPYYSAPPVAVNGQYCDPQLGCSDRMVGEDLSQEHAWQFNQEFRFASNLSGPVNFSGGINYTRYRTLEDYYVFLNLITASEQVGNRSAAGDYEHCYPTGGSPYNYPGATPGYLVPPTPYYFDSGTSVGVSTIPSNLGCMGNPDIIYPGTYIDPNPITDLDGMGHNYFRSENPYSLTSFAGFGEVYYQITPDVKLTGGLRWTDDKKRFWNIPSWLFLQGGGLPVANIIDQQWKEWTGRFNANWTPKLDFTDQTIIYASYSRGYKGGGANPPGPEGTALFPASIVTHPATFAPEFVNAFEVGTKNSLLDGAMTFDGDFFFYDYKGYQISQIIDRTSVNLNINAKVHGLEIESTWEPLPGLHFNFAGGYESSSINKGQSAIDLMDRTAGHSDWQVVKPSIIETSNCVLPTHTLAEITQAIQGFGAGDFEGAYWFSPFFSPCVAAYHPFFGVYDLNAVYGVSDFDPSTAPNGGAGFAKDLGGNALPNTPPFTLSLGGQYSMPISPDWAATLRADGYWQGNSFARIFNDKPYDQLRGYTNLNLALILTNQDGWQAMAYMKNVFNTAAITGAFLNSDDASLTTNVFVTDPRLFGVRLTKNW